VDKMSNQEHRKPDVTDPQWLRRPIHKHLEEALQKFPFEAKRKQIEHLRLPFETVDSAVARWLPARVLMGWDTRITPVRVASAFMRYDLYNQELGPVGSVHVRQLDPNLTELVFEPPPKPLPRTRHSDEYDDPRNRPGQDLPPELVDAFFQQNRDEQNTHYYWRRAYFARTIINLWEHIIGEKEWVAKVTGSGDTAEDSATQRYDTIVAEAQQRSHENGLSRDTPPSPVSGPEQIFDWLVAYWIATGGTFEEFKRQHLPTEDSKEVSRRWDKYREKYKLPTFTELKKLRGQKS
jgi:hypothetical protein